MDGTISPLEQARLSYRPSMPPVLRRGAAGIDLREGDPSGSVADPEEIRRRFPHTFGRPGLRLVEGRGPGERRPLRVGVVLSGGQAPGGHNVIAGLFDGIRGFDPRSGLVGFLGGPKGIFARRHRELTPEVVDAHRNTGGFDMIGSGRDKVETAEQLAASVETCRALGLDGLVVVGGDDSNTNAAALAEFFHDRRQETAVVGVPKTIDGDMKGRGIEASFGFDTATKVYSDLVGNICRDARSAGKYWHFIKLMGRSASHVALECGLQTGANVTLIGEEIRGQSLSLGQIAEQLVDVITRRRAAGRSYGVCLVPEGLIEFVPEVRELIAQLNVVLHEHPELADAGAAPADRVPGVLDLLAPSNRRLFATLPQRIQGQLLLDRDSHGNVQVSKIDTEALLVDLVRRRLDASGARLDVQHHFFGYEGRCAAPSNFDADYAYALGQVAAALVAFRRTGYICAVQNLAAPPEAWRAAAIPLTSMMQIELRKGNRVPVIAKALVSLDGAPFRALAASRERTAIEDRYLYPGAIQYFGPDPVSRRATITLALEHDTTGAAEGGV